MDTMTVEREDELLHYGMPRRSGRYPYGSGKDPYQHSGDLLSRIETLKKQGLSDTEIAKSMGLTTTQFRTERAIAKDERRMLVVARAKSLKEDGLTPTEIGKQMGVNESTVRSWLNSETEARMNKAKETAKFLKEHVDSKGMVDVGAAVNRELNISKEKMDQALYLLQREGYHVYGGRTPQVTNPGKLTTLRVLCKPEFEHKDIFQAFKEGGVHSLNEYITRDNGETYEKKFHYPSSMDSKRMRVRYNEEGGLQKDGVIELRRGVDDLSLGESRYSQVRILVDGTHYIKGMAVYSDNMPDGVDVIFNTNKPKGTPLHKVLKEIKKDPDNPFGSAIKDAEKGGQYWYTDKKTGERKLGLINKRADEGDWTDWKDALPSQFLSKQSLSMAKKQLGLAVADKVAEFDELKSLNNPTVKKKLLQSFADDCDAAAVHLKAAALPGQKYHVIMPINSLTDREVYAPRYENGTELALIRYPHGGTFEIPILKVNNKNKLAKQLLGTDATDVVGINSKVAERLSGADFDGDTVMCIPTNDKHGRVKITSTPALKGLEGFDPKTDYASEAKTDSDGTVHYYRNGREIHIMKNTGTQMGIVSNLITDMTLKGATQDELARAVRHSMVVIDAEKHKLDYKASEADNGIASLRKQYQGRIDSDGKYHQGASTLISRASGEQSVDKRQGTPKVNIKGKEWYDPSRPEGALIYKTADDVEYTYTKTNKRTGETMTITKRKQQPSTQMAEVDDARKLISDRNTDMEKVYADHANAMKSLANEARKEMIRTGKIEYKSSAKKVYQAEVESLMTKLNKSELNAPRERQAQLLSNAEVNAKKQADPTMKPGDVKKASQLALTKYRNMVGAKREPIIITDREWEAIQAGAVNETTLNKILKNTDTDNLRQRATPRTTTTISNAKANKIKAMNMSNYSISEIAKACGVSTSTVSNYLKGVN